MHFLAVSLLAILAGTLLLAKTKKEGLGKFFKYISWFFVVVGFVLFIGFLAGGICKMSHCCKGGQNECRQEMMMKDCGPGMHEGMECPPGMCKGTCDKSEKCMQGDSMMKCCPGHKAVDSTKMPVPKAK
jgi:hypothetical protein